MTDEEQRRWPARPSGDLPRWAFALLAAALPLSLLALHHDLGHRGDVGFFLDWYRVVSASPAFYGEGPGVNYPALGVLWVCLPGWLVEALTGQAPDFERYRLALKLLLTCAEALLIVVASGLARALGLRRPRLLALLLYLLPSTWAGGSWFGQIDVIGSALLLTAALGFVRFARWPGGRAGLGWLALGLVGLVGALLTKQLTYFSVPWLLALLAVGLVRSWSAAGSRRWLVAALLLAAPLLLFVPDPLFTLPAGHRSHFLFVAGGGWSLHGDLHCASGANLWSLLYEGPPMSSREKLLAGLPLRSWAIGLFLAVQAILLATALVEALRERRVARRLAEADLPVEADLPGDRIRALLSLGVLLVGLSNLAMATLLTGVHERYLVHGVPFLVLGLEAVLAGQPAPSRLASLGLRAGVWLVGLWSGLFVLASIHWNAFAGPLAVFRRNDSLALLQLAQLVALVGWVVGRLRRRAIL